MGFVVVGGVELLVLAGYSSAISCLHREKEGGRTPWYQAGSANGIKSPYASNASSGSASSTGTGTTTPLSACGFTISFFSAGGLAGGVGGAAAFLVSRDPTCSFGLYFLRIPSLWYFQNCLLASLPATRVRIFFPPEDDGLVGLV